MQRFYYRLCQLPMRYCIATVMLCMLVSSCFPTEPVKPLKVWGYKPVYTADTAYRKIEYIPGAQPVAAAGKIYVKGNFIYQCETGKGIHIIDNTVPASAKRIAFIKVKGAEEISIKGDLLYTNNYYDLITIDISTPEKATIVARNRHAFYAASSQSHTWEQPEASGYFECPLYYADSVISGWVQDSIYYSCYK